MKKRVRCKAYKESMGYENIFRMLHEKEIRYVVAGGVATVLHGVVRLTMDLDLIVYLEMDNVLRFVQGMTELGYSPKAPVKAEEFADPAKRKSWIQEKGMKVFSFCDPKDPFKLVDVFVEEPIPFGQMEQEKIQVTVNETPIWIVSKRHLIQLKKIAGREQDVADIQALKRLEEMEDGTDTQSR